MSPTHVLQKSNPEESRMHTRSTMFNRFTVAGMALAVVAIGPTNMFGTAIPTGDGGKLSLASLTLVGVTNAPPCISWVGSATCGGATHPMSVTSSSGDFVTGTGLIMDISVPVAGFQTVVGG